MSKRYAIPLSLGERRDVKDMPSSDYLANARRVAEGAEEDNAVTPQQRLLAGMFNPANFLDLMRNFIVYEPIEGRLVKRWPAISSTGR